MRWGNRLHFQWPNSVKITSEIFFFGIWIVLRSWSVSLPSIAMPKEEWKRKRQKQPVQCPKDGDKQPLGPSKETPKTSAWPIEKPSMKTSPSSIGRQCMHMSTPCLTQSTKGKHILMQLCTDHVPLNAHLYQIKKAATPYCPNCLNTMETTNHYLFFCHKYTRQRHKLVLAVKRKAFSKNFILTNEAAIRHTINYINNTGRFKHVLGDIKVELIEDGKRD